jgi:NTE family protein
VTTSKTTAFVLSGGASLGAIQVGMLRALYERGIAAELIVGTSVGAINGAFIASRRQGPETADELGAIWKRIGRGNVFPLNPFTGLLGFFGRRAHLVGEGALRQLLERHLEFDFLEGAPVPFHVIATDVLSGNELRLSRGGAVDAVMASAALPGVFPPVRWGRRALIDGGISNHTPISHAVDLGAETIYVLPTGYACDLPQPPRGALGMLLHAMTILLTRRLLLEIESLRDRAQLVVLPPPCPLKVSPLDFGRAEELIQRGLSDARAHLEAVDAGEHADRLPLAMNGDRGGLALVA